MMNATSTLTPNSVMFAVPFASPLALRSPSAFDSGRPGSVPSTAMAKCTLCTVLIAASDCCMSAGPAGRLVVDDEDLLCVQAAVVSASAAATATSADPRVPDQGRRCVASAARRHDTG